MEKELADHTRTQHSTGPIRAPALKMGSTLVRVNTRINAHCVAYSFFCECVGQSRHVVNDMLIKKYHTHTHTLMRDTLMFNKTTLQHHTRGSDLCDLQCVKVFRGYIGVKMCVSPTNKEKNRILMNRHAHTGTHTKTDTPTRAHYFI